MAKNITPQAYPRIQEEENKYHGFLDESSLTEHSGKIDIQRVKAIIAQAIQQANAKSSRQILNIPSDTSDEEALKIYEKEGRKLFDYFLKYYDDPAATAIECQGLHYSDVAREQIRNRDLLLQKIDADYRNRLIARNPFVSKLSCIERTKLISDVLAKSKILVKFPISDKIIEAFGNACKRHQLVDSEGYFNNPNRLMNLFCRK